LNGIIIATPPALHVEMACAAVKAGLGALVEKPLSLNLAEALELSKLVAEYKGCVRVDHTYLYHPAYRKLKEIVSSQQKPMRVRSVGGNWGPFRTQFPILWDWGAHDIAMCLDLFGRYPTSIEGQCIEMQRVRVNEEEGALYLIRLSFGADSWAEIMIGNLMKQRTRLFEVQVGNTVLVMDDTVNFDSKLKIRRSGEFQEERTIPIEHELPLDRVVLDFSKALRFHDSDPTTLLLGVDVVRVLTKLQNEIIEKNL
jgi:predicted dehydrogenase